MFVCICKGITDTQIREAIDNGAENMGEIRQELGVSSQCGRCVPAVKEVVRASMDAKAGSMFYQVA
ncbi:MAG: bacterioferritin-associated ferredoxin [Agarilytica sp.]